MNHWTEVNEFKLDFIDVSAIHQFRTLVINSGVNPFTLNMKCYAPNFAHQKCAAWVIDVWGSDEKYNDIKITAWVEWTNKDTINVKEYSILKCTTDDETGDPLWINSDIELHCKGKKI